MSAAAFRAAILAAMPEAEPPELIEPDRLHRFKNGRRGDRSAWCKLFRDMRAGVFGCWRTGLSETWTSTDRRTMTPLQRADLARCVAQATADRQAEQRRQWSVNAERIERLQTRLKDPVQGDPVHQYLQRRGLDLWPLPACIRVAHALSYWHEGQRLGDFPAMVAPVRASSGAIVAMHCTYLTEDGRKAPVPTVKKLTPAAGPLSGACIPLAAPDRGVISIAEGIETALAASLASGVPTVAAYCAGALAGWQWPAAVQRLVIFADADKAGREAADTLRARALAARLRVNVLTPTAEGADWCDVWAGRDAVLIEAGGAA